MAGIPTAPTAGTPTAYTPTTDALSAFKSRIEEFHDASARDIDSIDAYFGGEGSYCSREVSDLWAHTIESLQSYLYSSFLRREEVSSELWQVYEDFYLANKDYHPVDPCIKGTHESLDRFYYRPLMEEPECPSGYETPPRARPASPSPFGALLIQKLMAHAGGVAKPPAEDTDAESMPPLERTDSPLTDEDIDEALYTIEAAWDY